MSNLSVNENLIYNQNMKSNAQLSQELEQLHRRKNYGRGITQIEVICYYLNHNKLEDAKNIAEQEIKLIKKHPSIQDWMYRRLFKDDPRQQIFKI